MNEEKEGSMFGEFYSKLDIADMTVVKQRHWQILETRSNQAVIGLLRG